MLRIEKLNVYYGGSHILRNVTLAIKPGSVVCLMGRNGAGKTTTLKTIAGLLTPKSGSITLDGEDLTPLSADKRARRGIGFVPQGREIFPQLTVRENLILGLGSRVSEGVDAIEEAFTLFPVLRQMLRRNGGDLSGGQQQQLAIARALLSRPRYLMLDEPTEGIQPSVISEIEEVILKIKSDGSPSIILIEQYLEFAWKLADYSYLVEKGTVVMEGTAGELDKKAAERFLAV
ncbi:MAG TPA: urea ABC transporter ATP-binding subunit UrtE [Edaphobacter sp.]|nr:urea ABC transporter ATP-binding subunit UrtE [Edaphobacter sp.]